MKTRILAFVLMFAMILPVIGIIPAFADEAPVWTANGANVSEADGGYYNVTGGEWDKSAYKTEKVQLEGLTVYVKVSGLSQAVGVILSGTTGARYADGRGVALTLWKDPFGNGQSRLFVGKDHDYNGETYAHTDPACTNKGFGLDKTLVLQPVTDAEYKIEINSYDENAYAVKITLLTPHLLWEANANYVAEQGGSVTTYIPKSVFASELDSDGKLYVSATGLGSPNTYVKVEESNPVVTPDPETPAASTIIGSADGDWVTYAGSASGAFADNGYTSVSNMATWGHRAYYKHLVRLDGLELSMRATTTARDCVGIIFSSTNGAYFGDTPLAITYWNNLYDGQARLNFGANHDYNAASVVYTAPDLSATKGFGVASSMVCSQAATMGWTIKFESYNDEFYSIKITMTDSTMWGNNANYNADELSCTVYLPKSTVAGMLNENGECYLIAAGFPSGSNPACSAEYKVVDDNYRAYISGNGVTNAIEKVTAYENAAKSITNAASYDAAMEARAAAVACAGELRARELAELGLWVGRVDADLAANENIVTIVKKAVTDKIEAATNNYYALIGAPTTINNETLAAALALANDAKAEYANRASMLNDEAKAEIEAGLALLDYGHDYCIGLQWVTTYEVKVAALDATSSTIVDDLVDVKSYRAAYESTTAYKKITTALTDEHKAELEGKIAAADAAVNNLENVVLPALKESYIVAMEEKLAADLAIKPNLDDAKAAYADIATYVTITEADGELYNRYVAGYETLKAACEAYVNAQIAEVSELLKSEYTTLDAFKPVRNKFKSIKLDYLMEDNSEIAAKLTGLEAEISTNVFYYMTSTNIPLVEQNSSGLAVESRVEFPARLNYNKALSLKAGVEIVVELTSAAYYNGGSQGANNLCFNLLAAPDSYKSMSDGISIIIWLFPTESNVQIMNNTDTPLASSSIATPLDGGTITISVKYEEYYSFVEDATYYAYVIRVNEAEIVLTHEALTNNGHDITDTVYFSMGSFADDKSTPNILTLVSANGVEFGIPSEEPECTEHVDADHNGKCDNCGAEVPVTDPDDNIKDPVGGEDDGKDDEEVKLSFAQKLARFFKNIIASIKGFFAKLFGKK